MSWCWKLFLQAVGVRASDAILINLIMNSPSKSCSLEPWPTFLVLDYLDILIIPITSIINASLEEGKCPNFFKQAHVTPILKKSSLDKEVFKNYRPVSNLNFISKILERVVAVQLQTHLDEAGLMTAIQSAYRKYHTAKSALLNIRKKYSSQYGQRVCHSPYPSGSLHRIWYHWSRHSPGQT